MPFGQIIHERATYSNVKEVSNFDQALFISGWWAIYVIFGQIKVEVNHNSHQRKIWTFPHNWLARDCCPRFDWIKKEKEKKEMHVIG